MLKVVFKSAIGLFLSSSFLLTPMIVKAQRTDYRTYNRTGSNNDQRNQPSSPTPSPTSSTPGQLSTELQQILALNQLIAAPCLPGTPQVNIWINGKSVACATPTSQYSAGIYIVTDTLNLRRAGVAREINPPSNSTDVSSVDRLLAQWNWTRVPCYSGSVFISGLSNETVCVSPTNLFPPGQYTYDRTTNQLVLINYPPRTNPIPAFNYPPQNQIIDAPASNSPPPSSDYPNSSI